LISESTGSGHSLELQGSSGATFNITELEETGSQTSISVEELPGRVVIFGELDVVDIFIEFAVVVDDMHGFFSKEFGEFGVLVQHISQISFLEIGVQSLISESSVEKEPRQDTEECKTKSDVREHVETEGETREEVELEGIIQSVSSVPPLVQTREDSVSNILDPSVEQGSGELGVFGLLDVFVLKAVLGVSVVGVLPFELPTFVVVVSIIPGNLVSGRNINEGGGSKGSEGVDIVEDDLLRGSFARLEPLLSES
jgi:hypothetical protein